MKRIALGRSMRVGATAMMAVALFACGSEPPAKTPALTADPPLDEGQGQGQGPAQGPEGGAAGSDLNRGIAEIKKEKYGDAIPHLQKAVQAQPKNGTAHFYLGLAKEKKGDKPGAEESYKAALETDPAPPEAAGNLAALYLDEPPRPDLAIALLEKAIKKSDNVILLQNMAYAYGLKKDIANASKYYDAALTKGDSADVRYAYASLLVDAKQLDKARDHLKKALALAGDKLDMLVTLAQMLDYAEGYADCVSAFDKAIKIKGDEPEWFVGRGRCRYKLDDDAGAIADYKAAIKVDAKFAAAHYYLALSMIKKKEIENAKAELKLAEQHGAGTPAGKAAKEKLAELTKKR